LKKGGGGQDGRGRGGPSREKEGREIKVVHEVERKGEVIESGKRVTLGVQKKKKIDCYHVRRKKKRPDLKKNDRLKESKHKKREEEREGGWWDQLGRRKSV